MKIFVYGGCVTRDLIPELRPYGHELEHYTARQSLVSAMAGESSWRPDLSAVSSRFQRRSLESDIKGDLLVELEARIDDIDVIFWDIMVERSGYYTNGVQVVTNSWELRHHKIVDQLPTDFRHVQFGTDEHFVAWKSAVTAWQDKLESLHLMHKVVFFAPSFTDKYRDGSSFKSKNYNLETITEQYRRYYRYLETETSFKIVGANREEVATDKGHQWGEEIFHFDLETRQLLALRALSYFGLCALSPAEHRLYHDGYEYGLQVCSGDSTSGEVVVGEFVQPFQLHKSMQGDGSVFFFNGAVDQGRAKGRPVFQRVTWATEVMSSSVFLPDPTLSSHPELSLGWGQGIDGLSSFPLSAGIVHGMIDSFGWESNVLYGSSAGGFQALMIASILPFEVEVRVNNPQTDWLKYEVRRAVADVISTCFPSESQKNFRDRHKFWVAPMYIWGLTGRIPKFEYFVNDASRSDVLDHLGPLNAALEASSRNPTRSNARIIHYFDGSAGHNPLDKQTTLRILNR